MPELSQKFGRLVAELRQLLHDCLPLSKPSFRLGSSRAEDPTEVFRKLLNLVSAG
jgi:hypothetical protein